MKSLAEILREKLAADTTTDPLPKPIKIKVMTPQEWEAYREAKCLDQDDPM